MNPPTRRAEDTPILQVLRDSSRGPLKPKEIARELDIGNDEYGALKDRLKSLEADGTLYRVKGNRYAIPEKINLAVGRLSVIRSGDGFVVPRDPADEDVFVPSSKHETAMDGDQVVVRIEGRPRGRNPTGRVIKILERAHPTVVGTFRSGRKLNYVEPRDQKMNRDILIPMGEENGARDGDVVVVEVVHYGDRKLNPMGEVDTVLGPMDKPGVDVLAILHGHGLPQKFPPAVEAAAQIVAERAGRPGPEEGRVDRRDLHVFTIDPSDAKDHDDALSVVPAKNGLWEVGIHIADVSAYVAHGAALDVEALHRGTSVYLVDQVVPMLPHTLSSDLCSLRPDEDRYAVSLFATLDGDGRVVASRFERTLIRSRHRLSYEEVEEVLSGNASVDAETDEAVGTLDRIARQLRRRRAERGSIDFDLPEARVILDDEGEPVDIQRVVRLDSHRLIEDFMLLANQVVAREAARKKLPVLHRVHESPTLERMEKLRGFLASVGQTLPEREIRPRDLQKVLDRVEGRPEEDLISTVILRSMQRARYETESLGHFGLAAEHYAHFTSPIRRYPDLVTHRVVIRALIEGEPVPESWGGEELESTAEWCSVRERAAAEAERDSVELKKIEYMERHLGDRFEGTVSGVTAFGFFVLLDEVFVEGLVHVNSLEDDYYEFREEEYSLVGSRKGRRFRLGDRVRVEVARLDREERHVDFALLETLSRDG
jgi:ribonuclease R